MPGFSFERGDITSYCYQFQVGYIDAKYFRDFFIIFSIFFFITKATLLCFAHQAENDIGCLLKLNGYPVK